MRRLSILLVAIAFALVAWNGTSGADETKKEAPKKKAPAHAKLDAKAPDFTLEDAKGVKHSLSNFEGKYVVLEWTNMDCPFVRKHYSSGNMQALQKKFIKKGVVWLRICSSGPGKQGNFDNKTILERSKKDKSMHVAYLIDADGTVGKVYGAKTTPHMYVIDPEGVLIYAGGIDDIRSADPGDVKRAKNYVDACLDAAMSGKKVQTKTAAPYGCSVKYRDS